MKGEIYFLFRGTDLIYIGQTKNLKQRLLMHASKKYNSVRSIEWPIDKLTHYESRLIKYFKPMLNRPTGGKRKGAGRPKTKEDTKVISCSDLKG